MNSHLLIVPVACLALLASCSPAPESDQETQLAKDWPTGLVAPIEGATFSLVEGHLPGGPVEYLEGPSQSFAFFNGSSGRPLAEDEAIVAIADGEVVRIDHDYSEPDTETLQFWTEQVESGGFFGEFARDHLRGRQVWLRHTNGDVSRYAHLSRVHPELQLGDSVTQGQPFGLMGNSGIVPTADQQEPAPRLHFELWSPDGSRYLGQDLSPLDIHRQVARVFGPNALPRYARRIVKATNNDEPAPDPYLPDPLPKTSFNVEPPSEVTAGNAFAAPITWEGDDFRPQDLYALLEGSPLGIIHSGDGAWILGAMPLEFEADEVQLTIGGTDPYGQSLVGQHTMTRTQPAGRPAPREVDRGVLEYYSEQNRRLEAEGLARATIASLQRFEPRWTTEFQPPIEGDVIGGFGQRMVTGPMMPVHPLPGYLIRPAADKSVLAANDGVVAMAGELPIRGRTVVIDHGGGVISVYAHLDSISVEQGEMVSKGEPIATAGRSGAFDEEVLRWEIHVAGIASNPGSWLGSVLPKR